MTNVLSRDSKAAAAAPPAPAKRKPILVEFWSSAVGKKWVMAVTGLMMIGFVIAHMVGNLKVYFGPADYDAYGEFLRRLAYPLLPKYGAVWILRLGLLAAVGLHILAAVQLTIMNRKARPVRYKSHRTYLAADAASMSMRLTGIVILAFIIFHLADLTIGIEPAASGAYTYGEVYANVFNSFSRWPVALFYIVANLLLAVHLYHGGWSMFQSLGWNNPKWNSWRRGFAIGLAVVIGVGNISIPIAVLTGVIAENGVGV